MVVIEEHMALIVTLVGLILEWMYIRIILQLLKLLCINGIAWTYISFILNLNLSYFQTAIEDITDTAARTNVVITVRILKNVIL